MLDIYFCLPSFSPFLNVAKLAFGHIKSHVRQNDLQNYQTLLGHIHDEVQAIAINMVQSWLREVNQKFDRASRRDLLGESYT